MKNFFKEKLGSNYLTKASLFLMLTFIALTTLKITLSNCTIFSSENCHKIVDSSTTLRQDIATLENSISELEKSVSKLECPPVNQAATQPIKKINEPLWAEGNIEAISGCWSLDWDYSMRHELTNEIVGVKAWEVCFPTGAQLGQQTLTFDDGISCVEQPISGKFTKNAKSVNLLLDDTKNVACEEGHFIYQRKLTCRLAEDASHAMCSGNTLQSDGTWAQGPANEVRLSRGNR